MELKDLIKKTGPKFLLKYLHQKGYYKAYSPTPGTVNKGDFNRTTPLSNDFGYDRGGPVDRYYIENFLQKNTDSIKGDVLEIGDNEYTIRYGSRVAKSDILHVDDNNPKATFIGDLSNAPQLADNSFDCLILTQTLHCIYDYKSALATCFRILKPGGVLLLTSPGLSPIDRGEWGPVWYYAFTKASIQKMLSDIFGPDHVDVESFGNVLVATSFLYGLGLSEITKKQLDEVDPCYQVIISAKAVKPHTY